MNLDDYIANGRLNIVVKTNAPKTKIVGFDKTKKAVKTDIHAQPEKGKANAEIIKFFSRLTKRKVDIIAGKTSKQKTLRFR